MILAYVIIMFIFMGFVSNYTEDAGKGWFLSLVWPISLLFGIGYGLGKIIKSYE